MDNITLDYRDPLFGIIVLFTFIFLISFFTYYYGIYKEKKSRREYRKLYKRFEMGNLKEDDYVHLYKTYNLPFDSILLLASTFLHKGNYNKAINVYLALLEHINDSVKKEELLEQLGITYFKSGFLQRSKEIFLRILKFSPRNKNALIHLQLVYEKLKDFKKAQEVTACLNELNIDVSKNKTYLESLIILNDPILSYEKKSKQLFKIYKEDKNIERLFLSFLLNFNKTFFWKNVEKFDCRKIVDLMWYLNFDDIDFNKVLKNDFLVDLYNAKGFLNTKNRSEDFILDILIILSKQEQKINTSLDFQFICEKCKHSNPMFENRCSHCHGILSYNIKYTLSEGFKFEENQSLQ